MNVRLDNYFEVYFAPHNYIDSMSLLSKQNFKISMWILNTCTPMSLISSVKRHVPLNVNKNQKCCQKHNVNLEL